MTLAKDDERWLACLDRAIHVATVNGGNGRFVGTYTVEECATQFYLAMLNRRTTIRTKS